MNYLATLPDFIVYYCSAVAMFLAFAGLYTLITPYNEWREIKENRNASAALSLIGALVGFAIPIASLIKNAVNLADFLIWGCVAALAQFVTFFLVALLFGLGKSGIKTRIEEREISDGIMLAGLSIITGIFNAACMTTG